MKKKTPKSQPEWLTLAEAKEADDERHVAGVLLDLGERFAGVGIVKIRVLAHDGAIMKAAIAEARKAAVRTHNEGKAALAGGRSFGARDKVYSWEQLPPEGHRAMEAEIAAASVRGGEGVELHGSFEPGAIEPDELPELFRALLGDAPDWVIKGILRSGAQIVSSPALLADRMILGLKKKGSAFGAGPALASIDGAGTAAVGSTGALQSRLAQLLSGVIASQNTTPPAQTQETPTPSTSTA